MKFGTVAGIFIVSLFITACQPRLMDVHGAGAQRSDPKKGNPADYPYGHGPQGDVIRIYNFSRLVRGDSSTDKTYPVVDTNQTTYYDDTTEITAPLSGAAFYGQDAQNAGIQPSYTDNGNGTVTDNNTGLMWQQDCGSKMTWADALSGAATFNLGDYNDWRLPSIKELYSLIQFSGSDPSGSLTVDNEIPFLDTSSFTFEYGDPAEGERYIDAQYASSTQYVSTTMNGDETIFGVNFADGRIKGYGLTLHGTDKTFFIKYVRDNTGYGSNNFLDNGDGTVTDLATGLMWMQVDSGHLNAGSSSDGRLNWEEALNWAENLSYAGYDDWRLPDAKELQSIVDYTRSPDTTNSAAIDNVLQCSTITDEGGGINYPFYWSSTTHATLIGGSQGVYIAFGEALGFMSEGLLSCWLR